MFSITLLYSTRIPTAAAAAACVPIASTIVQCRSDSALTPRLEDEEDSSSQLDTARLMVESRAHVSRSLSLSALFSTLKPLHIAHQHQHQHEHLHEQLSAGAGAVAGVHLSRRDTHDMKHHHPEQHAVSGASASAPAFATVGGTAADRALVEIRRLAAAAATATAQGTGTMAASGGARGAHGTMAIASEQHLRQLLAGTRTSPTRARVGFEHEHQSHSRRAALARGDVSALGDALQVRRAEFAAVERERERALLELHELQAHSAAGTVRSLLFSVYIIDCCTRIVLVFIYFVHPQQERPSIVLIVLVQWHTCTMA